MRLKDRVAVVVGAGQSPGQGMGNGRATAITFAREGASVLCVDRNLASAQETVGLIEAKGGNAAAFEADATTADPRFAVVEPVPAVLDDAVGLAGVHGLRAYDAVQLASARAAAAVDDRVRTFAAFDEQLRGAAAREGFVLVP